MILDKNNELSSAQRVCNGGATEVSENVYDCGAANANTGMGEPLIFVFTVDAAFAGTATTLTVNLQDCTTAGGTYYDIPGASSGAIAKATLVAGYQFTIVMPPTAHDRYIGVNYVGDNTFETTGTITCQVVKDFQSNRTW
jgi:hypothetical protein